MKKTVSIFLIALLLSILCFASCANQDVATLKSIVKQEQFRLPVDYPDGNKIEKIDFNAGANTLSIDMKVGDPLIYKTIINNNKLALKYLQLEFLSDNPKFWDAIIAAKTTLKVHYENMRESCEVKYPPATLSGLSAGHLSDNQLKKKLLDLIIEIENNYTPVKVGHGMEMKELKLEGQNLVAIFQFDEEVIPVREFKEYMNAVEGVYLQGATNVVDEDTEEILKELNYDLVYRWKGSAGYGPIDMKIPL